MSIDGMIGFTTDMYVVVVDGERGFVVDVGVGVLQVGNGAAASKLVLYGSALSSTNIVR